MHSNRSYKPVLSKNVLESDLDTDYRIGQRGGRAGDREHPRLDGVHAVLSEVTGSITRLTASVYPVDGYTVVSADQTEHLLRLRWLL